MKHCMECGTELLLRYHEGEKKEIPFCPTCNDWRFKVFNTAVSMIVMNQEKNKILLIKQYGRDFYVLVAGYVNHGEEAENAVCREIKEEVGLEVTHMTFNRSHFFEPSNTLMLNFAVCVKDEEVSENEEIDSYNWFSVEEAVKMIRPGSLAKRFLEEYLETQ